MKPRLLDVFSGAGGSARGYQLAGFHVTGVDLDPQPRYAGDDFVQGDALHYLAEHRWSYDAVHASPPCQRYTRFTVPLRQNGTDYPDLLALTRERLNQTGLPWVVENVPGAPMRPDLTLCGTQFGLRVRRHRLFETNWPVPGLLPPCDCAGGVAAGRLVGHREGGRVAGNRQRPPSFSTADRAAAMGIDWMTGTELREAIPPAMTRWVGERLLAHLTATIPLGGTR